MDVSNSSFSNPTNISYSSQEVPSSFVICLWTLLFLIIVANGVVIFLFFHQPKLRTGCNTFLASLALLDAIGACTIPIILGCYKAQTRQDRFTKCITSSQLHRFLALSSIAHILAITNDKYHAIVHPLYHRSTARVSRSMKIISAMWFVPICVAIIPVSWILPSWNSITNGQVIPDFVMVCTRIYDILCMILGFLVPLFITVLMDVKMLCRIFGSGKSLNNKASRAVRRSILIHRHLRTVSIFVILLITYAACWILFFVLDIMDIFYIESDKIANDIVNPLLRYLNCLTNPLLYTFFKKDFQMSLMKFFRMKMNRSQSTRNTQTTLSKRSSSS